MKRRLHMLSEVTVRLLLTRRQDTASEDRILVRV
jgi:hypothetical protein